MRREVIVAQGAWRLFWRCQPGGHRIRMIFATIPKWRSGCQVLGFEIWVSGPWLRAQNSRNIWLLT